MAYPKNSVNTATALRVVKSDTINIPNPALLQVSSTTSATTANNLFDINVCSLGANGTTNVTLSNGYLVDTSAKFEDGKVSGGTPSYFPPVVIKNYVENDTDSVAGHITEINTNSRLIATINFVAGKAYEIYNQGFNQRLKIQKGDLVVNTTDNTIAFVEDIINDAQLELSADIMASGENYSIYNQNAADLDKYNNEGFLIYVGSTASITQDIQPTDPVAPGVGTSDPRYVDVKVLTVNNQEIVFENFKVGEYLPVQCKRVFSTGTDAAVDCIAIS